MKLSFDEALLELVNGLKNASLEAAELEAEGTEIDNISACLEINLASQRVMMTLSIEVIDE